MKKRSTLIFIVKEFAGTPSEHCDLKYRDFLASSDADAEFSPSDSTIRKIMDFARAYDVLDSDTAGPIELINN